MQTEANEFYCQCGRPLNVPKELIKDLQDGKEVVLRCEFCQYYTKIESGEVVRYIPPKAVIRWTETFITDLDPII